MPAEDHLPPGGSIHRGSIPLNLNDLPQELAALEACSPRSTLEIFTPAAEHEPIYRDLCRLFLAASALARYRIQYLLMDKEGIQNGLLGYAYHCARQLQASKDESWLQLGVAATALAGQAMDYRDLLLAQAELFVVAEEAGCDPNPAFKAIAGLDQFDTYAVVRSRRSGTHRLTPPEPDPGAENEAGLTSKAGS